MTKPDLKAYTVEQLEAMNTDLMRQRAALIVTQRAVAHALEDKRKAHALASDLAHIQKRHGVALQVVE